MLNSFIFGLMYIMPCSWWDDVTNAVSNIGDTIKNSLNSWISAPIRGLVAIIDYLWQCSTSMIFGIKDYISLGNPAYNGLRNFAEPIYNSLAAIGVGICLLFWFVGIIDKMTKEQLSVYTLIRSFIQIILAMGVITFGFQGFQKLANVGNDITTTCVQAFSSNVDAANSGISKEAPLEIFMFGANRNDLMDPKAEVLLEYLMTSLLGVIISLLYWLFSTGVAAFGISVCVSRVIQLYIYLAMAPIGISQMFNRGGFMDSSAMTYLKKIVAISLQGPIMMLIITASQSLTSTFMAGGMSGPLAFPMLFVIGLVTISLFMKSQQFANDIVS